MIAKDISAVDLGLPPKMITLRSASEPTGMSYQALHAATYHPTMPLKIVVVGRRIYTTPEWLREWIEAKNCARANRHGRSTQTATARKRSEDAAKEFASLKP